MIRLEVVICHLIFILAFEIKYDSKLRVTNVLFNNGPTLLTLCSWRPEAEQSSGLYCVQLAATEVKAKRF